MRISHRRGGVDRGGGRGGIARLVKHHTNDDEREDSQQRLADGHGDQDGNEDSGSEPLIKAEILTAVLGGEDHGCEGDMRGER